MPRSPASAASRAVSSPATSGERSLPDLDHAREVGAQHEVPGQVRRFRLGDRGAQALDGHGPVAPHGDDRVGGAGGEGGQQDPLEEQVRVPLGQGPIAERGRIRADQVGDDHLAVARGGTGGAPLVRRRISAATTSAQAGRGDLVDRALWPQLLDRAGEARVAADLAVALEAGGVDDPDLRQQALVAAGQDPDLR